jgi:proteasome lid subunit RPN8/RPN11
MTDDLIESIRAHAFAQDPHECCGVVLIAKGRQKYVPMQNMATTPAEHFVIDPAEYAQAEDAGEITHIVHSHVNLAPIPSEGDLVGIEQSGLPWIIVNWPTGAWTETKPSGYKAPLVGRSYQHGALDCYSIIVDYFAELGIELPDFDRDDKWWLSGKNLYADNFGIAGFSRVGGPPQKHDVLLMQIASPVINHGAIFLGDGMILQHCANRLSSRDVWGGAWQRSTVAVVRHNQFMESKNVA